MSFFNRIIGWQRQHDTGHSKTPAQAATMPLSQSSECWCFLYGFAMPLAAKCRAHLSLYVIFAMHWPNSGNSMSFTRQTPIPTVYELDS